MRNWSVAGIAAFSFFALFVACRKASIEPAGPERSVEFAKALVIVDAALTAEDLAAAKDPLLAWPVSKLRHPLDRLQYLDRLSAVGSLALAKLKPDVEASLHARIRETTTAFLADATLALSKQERFDCVARRARAALRQADYEATKSDLSELETIDPASGEINAIRELLRNSEGR